MESVVKNLLPVFILLFAVIGCTKLARQPPGKYEEQKKVVEILNEQFDLRNADRTVRQVVNGIKFDCTFQFRLGLQDDKITLIASFCESTSDYEKEQRLVGVLTPENLALIKNAGFEQVVLYDRSEYTLMDKKEFP
jgi:hypothetical protein